jgi:predicted RNA-binding Zn-ribbon protein involved in translation (DUF1610 family)
MNCPTCSNKMITGTLALNGVSGIRGLGVPGLFFIQEQQDRLCILAVAQARIAYCCEECGTVIISGRDATESHCLDCGEAMAAGITVCPKCGWTYKQ